MGFLNPWGGLAALSVIPIMYLYFFKHEKIVLEISSIMTWRALDEDRSSHRSSFLFDFILILQILIALVLTAILLRIYYMRKVNYKYKVILFDVSASMNTVEPNGNTRIGNARQKALKYIDELKDEEKVAVVQVGYAAKQLNEFTDSHDKLKSIIKKLEGMETKADFQGAFSLVKTIREEHAGSSLVIVSDISDFTTEMFNADVEDISTEYLDFPYRSSDNLGITSLDVHQNVYDSYNQKVYITVQNDNPSNKTVVLDVSVGNLKVFSKKIDLAAKASHTIPLGQFKTSGILTASLAAHDSLSADNRAFDIIRGEQTIRLLLVSNDPEMIEAVTRIAKAARTIKLTALSPSEFPRKQEVVLKKNDIVIFHQYTPPEFVSCNQIYIDPPPSTKLFAIEPEKLNSQDVVDWSRTSPMLRHLDYLDELRLVEVSRGGLPDWGSALMASNTRTLAFWGKRNHYKIVCFYFDLGKIFFPQNQDITGLVMYLNLIDWLVPPYDAVTRIEAGEKFILHLPQKMSMMKVIGPDGREVETAVKDKLLTCPDTLKVGIYRVEGFYGDTTRRYVRKFLVNLLNVDETAISPQKIVLPEGSKEGNQKSVFANQQLEKAEIWRYLIMAALTLLLVEWSFYFKRLE